jgi:molybdopterin molybdotransferase
MALMSFESARAALLDAAPALAETETLPLTQAVGRVLAADIVSPFAVPGFDNSAMDGYALRTADVPESGTRLPVSQRIAAGSPAAALAAGTAARIFTGAPVPAGADAIVMQEDTRADGDAVIIDRVPKPDAYIRRAGSEIRTGDVVLAAGTPLTAAALGLAASLGYAQVEVRRPLKVAIFFTGSELVMPGTPLGPGQIYNSNRFVLLGLLARPGIEVRDLGIVPDNFEATRAALRDAARDADLILTSGGMSVGEEDYVTAAVEAEGLLDVWKIAVKPGKPVAFGRVNNGENSAAFIGLPGNPVSVWVGFVTLVLPYLRARMGLNQTASPQLKLRADFEWSTRHGRREFVRVRRNAAGGLDRHPNQDSGALSSAAWCDGLADIPANVEVRPGDLVDVLVIPGYGD